MQRSTPRLTSRITDPALVASGLKQRRHRRVRCICCVELSRYAAGFVGGLGSVGFDGHFFAVRLPNGVYDTY